MSRRALSRWWTSCWPGLCTGLCGLPVHLLTQVQLPTSAQQPPCGNPLTGGRS